MKDMTSIGSKLFFGNILGPFGILAFWLFGKQAISVRLRFDELLEGILKEHEDQIRKKDSQDFMDILLKVYQDDKAEVKMTRTDLKALLTVSNFCFRPSINGWSLSWFIETLKSSEEN